MVINYKQAAQDFTSPQWKGIAEYKAKQYEQAIETLKPLQDRSWISTPSAF